jgi:hypothetical protein
MGHLHGSQDSLRSARHSIVSSAAQEFLRQHPSALNKTSGAGFRVIRQPTGRDFASGRILFGFRDFKKFFKQNNQPPLLFPHFA